MTGRRARIEASYKDVWYVQGEPITGEKKVVHLPFERVSARAIIVRQSDGSILGTLHRSGGSLALPGGAVEDGESTLEAVLRELAEENIELIDPDDSLENAFVVDYFDGYGELSVWHMFLVQRARIGKSDENIESRWVDQEEDVWYPGMREKLILAISAKIPAVAKVRLTTQ
ncbi:MAG: NUDIX hydrolase [Anaerolineales bacterium]